MSTPHEFAHILVLEDDPVLREILCELLGDEGYSVSAAGGGQEALQQIQQAEFDLLVFDIRMEGMDGLETLARMQAQGARFPALAITGFAGDEDPIRALRLGVGDYLRKPFQPDQLLNAVARLLARSRQEQQTEDSLRELRALTSWSARHLAPQHQAYLHKVDALATAAELHPAQAAQLTLTALVSASKPEALADAPPAVQGWQAARAEHYDGSGPAGRRGHEVPWQSQILELAAHNHTPAPGRFDPLLLEALDRLDADRPEGDARRWLGLAHTLLARGQHLPATTLLRQLAAASGPEAVEAALTLAELEPKAAADWVRRGAELARGVGPLSTARAMQRGALLLHRFKFPEAPAALAQAAARLASTGLAAESILVRTVGGDLQPDQLELLLHPEHEAVLAPQVDLLWDAIKNHPQLPERLQKRVLLRYPHLSGTPSATLRLASFGPFTVTAAGKAVEESAWRGPMVKYLFAYLARPAAAKGVAEETLLDAFWPEGHENSRRRLSSALSALRRTLASATGSEQDPVLRSRDRLSLQPSLQISHDVKEFEEAAARAEALTPAQALPFWTRMITLHAGPYLEGCYMDWALEERQKLEARYARALLASAAATLETQPERCLESAQRALQLDPFDAQAHRFAMSAWSALRQPENALRHYGRYTALLQREMQLEPPLELVELYHRIRLTIP